MEVVDPVVVDMVVALAVDGFKLRKVGFKFCCLP